MASAFGHAFAAVAFGTSFSSTVQNWKFWMLGMFCAIFPDADVVGFKFGIAYASFWGHRGFSHSLVFAALFGVLITAVFFRRHFLTKKGWMLVSYFSVCTASHALLDAMTTGGLGVAFFAPFNNTRYFFPWRPIQVSPIGIDNFLSEWGKRVLYSEAIWIGIPGTIYMIVVLLLKKIRHRKQR